MIFRENINGMLIHSTAWKDLKYILLSKGTQTQRLHTVGFHSSDTLEKTKTMGQNTYQSMPGAAGGSRLRGQGNFQEM